MKSISLLFIAFLFSIQLSYSQSYKSYIDKSSIYTLFSVQETVYAADDILNITIFNSKSVNYGDIWKSDCYTYLGIDSQNNLHILKKEGNNKTEKLCELIFKIDPSKPSEIILNGHKDIKFPLLIKLQITVSQNYIQIKYLGDVPAYIE